MYYNYEAEVLAQRIRKNSWVETVAKMVREVVDDKLRLEGLEYTVDDENAGGVAEAILAQVK